jgi:hypothetical protein
MTLKDQDTIIEGILNIRKRIDKYAGRERHIFLIACRANIRLSKLIKSKRQFVLLGEYEEYSRFVDEQLEKSASTLSLNSPLPEEN